MFWLSRVISGITCFPTVIVFVLPLLIRCPTFFSSPCSPFVMSCKAPWLWSSRARSSAKSRSASLLWSQLIPKSLLSMVFLITNSITMRKRNGESIQPCLTLDTISNMSVSPLLFWCSNFFGDFLYSGSEFLYCALKTSIQECHRASKSSTVISCEYCQMLSWNQWS